MAALAYFFWPFGGGSSTPGTSKNSDRPKSEPVKPLYRFYGGVLVLPHDDKVHKGGEDAFAATKTLLAVADGVGGWSRKGIDPGLFSKQLCKDIQSIYESDSTKPLK